MNYIDTHAHLNFQAYRNDADQVIRRALDNDVHMIIPSAEQATSTSAVQLATKYQSGVYAAVGLHPVHLQNQEFIEEGKKVKMKAEKYESDFYKRLCQNKKVVAVGECGLDYHYLPQDNKKQEMQKQQLALLQQLELAYNLDKPAIIHCREAHEDLKKLLENFYTGKKKRANGRGVLHCFSGSYEQAWQYYNLGFYISFTGLITFPPKAGKQNQWDELIKKFPLEKIMIETDSPFMSPAPNRGKRNEPINVKYVAERIAEIRKIKVKSVAKVTTENARKLFDI